MLLARDIMQSRVETIVPDTPLADVARRFVRCKVGGLPVVEHDQLVGLVARSDIVRQLCVEQSLAEIIVADYYLDGSSEESNDSLDQMANRIGQQIEHLKARDVMVRMLFTVHPESPLEEVAQVMLDHHVHHVPVTDGGRLVGVITSLDFVRMMADGKLRQPESPAE